MPEQDRVVDLSLSEPGLLVSGGEDFDGDALALPLAPPHLPVPTLTCQEKTRTQENISNSVQEDKNKRN